MPLLRPGERAPHFALRNQQNILTSLEQFRGHYVLLWWYPKADTPGCTVEGKGFRDLAPDFGARNAVILGASFDLPAANRAFQERFGFPFDLLSDPDRRVGLAYGAADSVDTEMPARISYLIDPDGRIAASYGVVVPARHPAEVLRALA